MIFIYKLLPCSGVHPSLWRQCCVTVETWSWPEYSSDPLAQQPSFIPQEPKSEPLSLTDEEPYVPSSQEAPSPSLLPHAPQQVIVRTFPEVAPRIPTGNHRKSQRVNYQNLGQPDRNLTKRKSYDNSITETQISNDKEVKSTSSTITQMLSEKSKEIKLHSNKCKLCGLYFTNPRCLRKHINKTHKSPVAKIDNVNEGQVVTRSASCLAKSAPPVHIEPKPHTHPVAHNVPLIVHSPPYSAAPPALQSHGVAPMTMTSMPRSVIISSPSSYIGQQQIMSSMSGVTTMAPSTVPQLTSPPATAPPSLKYRRILPKGND